MPRRQRPSNRRRHRRTDSTRRPLRGVAGTRLGFESLEGRLLLAADFGDAPDTYGTTVAAGGAQHGANGPILGVTRDLENDAAPSPAANGDGADEDGVTFGALRAGSEAQIRVRVTNQNIEPAKLDAWIDFDGDGTWSGALERIFDGVDVAVGQNELSFAIPSWATTGLTYARFRISTGGVIGPRGSVSNGEVEDYAIEILSPQANAADYAEQLVANGNKGAYSLYAVDMDRDGDQDLLASDPNLGKVTWHRNDGNGRFTQQIVGTGLLGSRVGAADLDGDGRLDVLTARPDGTASWYRQLSNGTFNVISLASANDVAAVDFLKDGSFDVALAGPSPNAFQTMYNVGTLRTVATGTTAGTSVEAADIDGDGDIDVLGASAGDSSLAWFESQPGTPYSTFVKRTIATDVTGVSHASLVDLDLDGDLDVLAVAAGDGTIAWFENDGAQNFTRRLVAAVAGVAALNHADIDGDGDLDLLVAAGAGGAKALLNDGAENFTATDLPTSSTVGIQAIAAADFDGDGVLEIAVGGSDSVIPTGTGHFAILRRQTLLDFGDAPNSYHTKLAKNGARHFPSGPTLGATRDSEADGGSTASPDGADEDGVTFGAIRIGDVNATITVNVQNAPAGARLDAWIDFDGDGTWSGAQEQIAASLAVVEGDNVVIFAVPVLSAAGQTYARFRLSTGGNLGSEGAAFDGEVEDYAVTVNSPVEGSGSFGSKTATGVWDNADLVVSADIDGDGDADIISSSTNSINWHENQGNGSYTRRNLANGETPETIQVVDLDGDGDQDIFVKSASRLYWFENNGSPTFVTRLISFEVAQHSAPVVIDYERDGDLDIIIGGPSYAGIRLFQNNGAGSFTPKPLIAPNASFYYRPTAIAVTDADGDGDLDIYASFDAFSERLALYRNDGADNFTKAVLVTMSGSARDRMLTPLDFDGDGDVDLVATVSSSTSLPSPVTYSDLVWYENRGNGDVDYRVISDNLSDFRQAVVGDLDGDGDYDVVSSIVNFGQIVWHENLGNETFEARQLSIESGFNGQTFYFALDLADKDGDGDLDVLVGSRFFYTGNSGIYWLPQLTTPARDYGDAPSPYPVTVSANGASHATTGPRLGAARDEETGPENSPLGDGDGADDDGVTISPIRVGQMGATFTVNVQNAPAGARLDAWIDFDGDGNWSRAEERIAANLAVVEGDNTLTFEVPAWAMAGASYARFRVSSAGKLGYTGAAADGEVEDYAVVIAPPLVAEGPYFERHLIDAENLGYDFRSLVTVDLDRDGDQDVVAPSVTRQLYWYENDGEGGFTRRILNGALASSPSGYLGAADVDLDGDVDLVAHSGYGFFVDLLINDGLMTFSRRGISSTSSNLGHQLSIVDIEGDGDLDYIGSNSLVKNIAGVPSNWSILLSGSITPPTFVADVDRNGTLDLIQSANVIFGTPGPGLAVSEYVIDYFRSPTALAPLTGSPSRLTAADLDEDGDLDLIAVTSKSGDNLLWLENDGRQNFTTRSLGMVSTTPLRGLQAADVDGDGDLDLLVSSQGETAWFENNGAQTFVKHVALNAGGAFSIADMNGDGALDVVLYDRSSSSGDKSFGLAWYSLTDRQVSVAAAPATIDEEGNASVVFTFTRAGVTDGELTVPFTVGGDALYGVDYTVSDAASFNATAGTITFAAGVTSVEVTLTPIDDAVKELHEQARLTIPPLAGYSIGNAIATATIRTAELAGDYNSDGTVDGADFLAWQRSFGQTAEPVGSGADGNLDGETDGDDLAVWTENFGETVLPPAPPEVALAALVAVEEDAATTATSAATASESWFGRLAGGEAAIIEMPAAESKAARTVRRHDVREEAFARTYRWSDGQIGVQRFQRTLHASSPTAVGAEIGDAEAFDELASDLAQRWREF